MVAVNCCFVVYSQSYYDLLGEGEETILPEVFDIKNFMSVLSGDDADVTKWSDWKKQVLKIGSDAVNRSPMNTKATPVDSNQKRRRRSSIQMVRDESCLHSHC